MKNKIIFFSYLLCASSALMGMRRPEDKAHFQINVRVKEDEWKRYNATLIQKKDGLNPDYVGNLVYDTGFSQLVLNVQKIQNKAQGSSIYNSFNSPEKQGVLSNQFSSKETVAEILAEQYSSTKGSILSLTNNDDMNDTCLIQLNELNMSLVLVSELKKLETKRIQDIISEHSKPLSPSPNDTWKKGVSLAVFLGGTALGFFVVWCIMLKTKLAQ